MLNIDTDVYLPVSTLAASQLRWIIRSIVDILVLFSKIDNILLKKWVYESEYVEAEEYEQWEKNYLAKNKVLTGRGNLFKQPASAQALS